MPTVTPRYIVGQIDQHRSLGDACHVHDNTQFVHSTYGQPFGTAGRYSKFKSITNANALSYEGRFIPLTNSMLSLADGTYSVDQNGDAKADYSFGNPNFNLGNSALTWWCDGNNTSGFNFLFGVDTAARWSVCDTHPDHDNYSFDFDQGHNIFLMKFTYRFRA